MEVSKNIVRALSRARVAILTIALAYVLSLVIGVVMVHAGNEFALSYRDSLVARAHADDPASIAYMQGNQLQAALLDFGRNLLLGAVPDTVGGTVIVIPYPVVIYRGWVGGIVSVDSAHVSRFKKPLQAAYYILTLILQLVPYSLAAGAGVNLGIAYFRPKPYYQGDKRFDLPREAIRDVLRIYVLVVPLFFIASLWEFLSPWN
jgi:uncharacterized membrane protein SpoIIM required for sporulation